MDEMYNRPSSRIKGLRHNSGLKRYIADSLSPDKTAEVINQVTAAPEGGEATPGEKQKNANLLFALIERVRGGKKHIEDAEKK